MLHYIEIQQCLTLKTMETTRIRKKSSIARQCECEYNNGESKENDGASKQPQAFAGAFVLGFLTA